MIPERLQPLPTSFDPDLSWAELVAVVEAVIAESLSEDDHEQALAFLDANLPGAEVEQLILWPGDWLGNRWYEEAALSAEEVVQHCAERCGRALPGAPDEEEP